MKNRTKKLINVILLTVLIFNLAACGNDTKTSEPASSVSDNSLDKGTETSGELTTVKTAYAPFIGGIVLYVMNESGFDKQNGINLEIDAYGNTSTLMSVITGDVDIAFTTIQAYMTSINALMEEGTDPSALPKIVYLHNESRGADGIVSKPEIKTVTDLKDRQVSAQYGNVTHYMLAKALASAGLTVDDVNFVDMSPGKGGSAFIAGNLDAATTFDPYLTQAVNEAGANLLVTTKDLERCIYDICVVSAKVAEEKPEWLTKTLLAVEDSTQYVVNNLKEASEKTAATFESTPEEVEKMCDTVYLYTMQDNAEAMSEDGWLPDSMKDIQDFYVSIGEMSPDIDFAALIDDSFLKK